MSVCTRCHALAQTLRRLDESDQQFVLGAVKPLIQHLLSVVTEDRDQLAIHEAALDLRDRIHIRLTTVDAIVAAAREKLTLASECEMNDFETVTELLRRFAFEMHAYCATLVSLFHAKDDRERWPHRFTPRTSWLVASISGARAAILLGMLSWFWVQTAWPSGGTMVLNAASIVALASSSGNPFRTALHLGLGTLIGVVLGVEVLFEMYPRIDGFPALCAVLAPLLLIGAFLQTQRSVATIGSGFCIFFSFLAGPDNLVRYDPSGFFNDSLALLLSMVLPALVYATLLPTEGRWLHRVLLRKLWAEVATVCNPRVPVVRASFESGARDLLYQLHTTTVRPEWRRESLTCFLAVLEVGHACIDIRNCLKDFRRTRAHTNLVRQLELVLVTQSRLASWSGRFTRTEAIAAIDRAHFELRKIMLREDTHGELAKQMNSVLASLHFLRIAMLDGSFPLRAEVTKPKLSELHI